MRFTLLALLVSANALAATTQFSTSTIPATAPKAEKVTFQIFTPEDPQISVTQPLQLLTLEAARPDTYTVDVRYTTAPTSKFANNTFWKTAYVAKFHRAQLAKWLECVSYDSETLTCPALLGLDLKPLKSKEKEVRAELVANLELAKQTGSTRGNVFINGINYTGPLAYGALLNETNKILPPQKQLAGLGQYETTKLWIIGSDAGFGTRDLALEREFARWIPNLQTEVVSPESAKGTELLTKSESTKIPAYVFDKGSRNNVSIQKLAAAGRIKINPTGFGTFEVRNGATEIKTATARTPNTLDLWVMSECPYGVKAESAFLAAQAQSLVKEGVKVNLRYIANEQKVDGKTTWVSLHGEPELQEDIRQITIQKTWPELFWKYLEARNNDLKGDWKTVATNVGLNPAEVEAKMPVGKKQMALDIKDSATLKVGGSPTYIWENRYVLGTPDEMKSVLGYNPMEIKQPTGKNPSNKTAEAASPGKCG